MQRSWWERFRCDQAYDEDAACLVVPPDNFENLAEPAAVLLFLTGNGHVDDREDFLWGGVDCLLRNPEIRSNFFVVMPKPTSKCGLLRYTGDGWRKTWAENAVWALFTEVLRRLGPSRVDPARLYATGYSLGGAGVWHLAILFGQYMAAIAPISGGCGWPGDSWPRRSNPEPTKLARLEALAIRAYQIDVDERAGNPARDMAWLCWSVAEENEELCLRGVDPGTTVEVKTRRWQRPAGEAWELWVAAGPLQDHSHWKRSGGDRHCLWTRVYPFPEWGMAGFLLRHSVPQASQWHFDDPPLLVDTTEVRRQQEVSWAAAAEEAKAQAAAPASGEDAQASPPAGGTAGEESARGAGQDSCEGGYSPGPAVAHEPKKARVAEEALETAKAHEFTAGAIAAEAEAA